ncbi:MAG: DNA replication complex GINS family protein, partial [Thermoplasmatales archaeon]|nr:DNA replication complex GINS family protein [Thermoplasmatales archaeon]
QEKTSPLLTKIDQKFYQKFSEYLKNLQRIAEKEDDANKLKLFDDEIQNTKKIAFNIYELREKKIIQAALSKVRGGKPDLKNLLEIEKRLYDSLVKQIIVSREEILEQKLEKRTDPKLSSETGEKKKKIPNTNAIVRVTQDTPEFVGTNMKTYSLRKDDVLTLPKEMSEPLLKRGVVEQIK